MTVNDVCNYWYELNPIYDVTEVLQEYCTDFHSESNKHKKKFDLLQDIKCWVDKHFKYLLLLFLSVIVLILTIGFCCISCNSSQKYPLDRNLPYPYYWKISSWFDFPPPFFQIKTLILLKILIVLTLFVLKSSDLVEHLEVLKFHCIN